MRSGLVGLVMVGLLVAHTDVVAQPKDGEVTSAPDVAQEGDPPIPKRSGEYVPPAITAPVPAAPVPAAPPTSVVTNYDRFANTTAYVWRWPYKDGEEDFEGIHVLATFKGKRTRGKPTQLGVVWMFNNPSWMFLRVRQVIFLADKKRYRIRAGHHGEVVGNGVDEKVVAFISTRTLKRIARAKKVEYRFGNYTGSIPHPILKALKKYARRLR